MRYIGKALGTLVFAAGLAWSGSALAFHGGGGFHGGFHGGFAHGGFRGRFARGFFYPGWGYVYSAYHSYCYPGYGYGYGYACRYAYPY
jgi:hypothetical protein